LHESNFLGILLLSTTFMHGQSSAPSSNSAPQQGTAQPEQCLKEGKDCKLPEPRWVDGLVKINLPSPDLIVGRPNKIPLILRGREVRQVTTYWEFSEESMEGRSIADAENVIVLYAQDRAAYVNFTPIRFGKQRFSVLIFFGDGSVNRDTVEVNVDRIPDRDPMGMIISDFHDLQYGGKAGTVHLDLSPQSNQTILLPAAFYGTWVPLVPRPSDLRNDIVFTIIPRKNEEPPFEFDPASGQVKAVKLGQALLKATIGGRSAYDCIDVMSDAREYPQRSNCDDFLPPDLHEPIDPVHTANPIRPLPQ
jgi:hypothetical protein